MRKISLKNRLYQIYYNMMFEKEIVFIKVFIGCVFYMMIVIFINVMKYRNVFYHLLDVYSAYLAR